VAPVWPGRVLAAGALAVVLFALARSPASLALPFPWQLSRRQILGKELRAAAFARIDVAAKTYYLLESRFPGSLSELAERGLLGRTDLRDPLGEPLRWAAREAGYLLAAGAGEPAPSSGSTEAITGNFLLDPDFLTVPASSEKPPLVLLD
jgi:hypothetical protein